MGGRATLKSILCSKLRFSPLPGGKSHNPPYFGKMPQAQPPRWGKILILPARSYNSELQPPGMGERAYVISINFCDFGFSPLCGGKSGRRKTSSSSEWVQPLCGERERIYSTAVFNPRFNPLCGGKRNSHSNDFL